MKHSDNRPYLYVVSCAGIRHAIKAYIRLRGDGRHNDAKRLARSQYPGMLAYTVQSVEQD